jgi:hypothetical protein
MRLIGRLVSLEELQPRHQERMLALLQAHYENVTPQNFFRDLQEKQWVILVLDRESGELQGFSTQMLLQVTVAGRPITALFSGDTIIDRAYWGDQALPHIWGQLALSLMDAMPETELYWFLISKGYKTYRFLPLFFHEFYPRWDAPTPEDSRDILQALAECKYPGLYDPACGVIRAGADKDRLRPGVAEVTPERLHDPHVRFFIQSNPGHAQGEELCCLAPLTRANFTRAAYRVIGPEPVVAGVSG